MKKSSGSERELKLQLVDVTPPGARRVWLPGAAFAAAQLDTRHWRREPGTGLDWQRTTSWHPRQLLN
jgi:hypothetical protein